MKSKAKTCLVAAVLFVVQGRKLTAEERADLVAFLRRL
jgi:hypothetical protein